MFITPNKNKIIIFLFVFKLTVKVTLIQQVGRCQSHKKERPHNQILCKNVGCLACVVYFQVYFLAKILVMSKNSFCRCVKCLA